MLTRGCHSRSHTYEMAPEVTEFVRQKHAQDVEPWDVGADAVCSAVERSIEVTVRLNQLPEDLGESSSRSGLYIRLRVAFMPNAP